ncbi:MAG: ligand-binding sensor domain-containing protein, partial [Luteibaculaceae bacterium]
MKKFTMACAIVAGALSVNAQQLNWDMFLHAPDTMVGFYEDLSIDAANNVWIAAPNAGVLKFDGVNFENVAPLDLVMYNNAPNEVEVDANGGVWFSTWGSGLHHINGQNLEEINTQNSELIDDRMYSMHVDSKGNIWSVYNEDGVSKFNGTQWEHYYDYTLDATDYIYATTIFEASNGNIYVGTRYGEVSVYDGSTWTVTVPSTPAGFSRVMNFSEDNNGNIWVATSGQGLVKITANGWEYFTPNNSGLPSLEVICLEFDDNNNAWIGTTKGLSFFNGTDWYTFDKDNSPLVRSDVNSISFDVNADMWLATGKGLFRISKEDQQNMAAMSVLSKSITSFNVLPVYPNPFSEELSFGVELQKPANIQLALTDVSGKSL